MNENIKAIYVSGHRNPDIDSISAAIALAELRRRQGLPNVQALCPGGLSQRAAFLLNRFHLPAPVCRNDVYVRVADLMDSHPVTIPAGVTLWEGFEILRKSGLPRLPVVDAQGCYHGMLSPMGVLNQLLGLGDQEGSRKLASREVTASVGLIARALDAKTVVAACDPKESASFQVYVAAMQMETFDKHLPWQDREHLAVIVGDRPDIQYHVITRQIRLLIVTGSHPVSPELTELARQKQVTILESPGDSAQVIRRLAFAPAVENSGLRGQSLILSPEDRLKDIAQKVGSHFEDVIPVLNSDKTLAGILLKKDIAQEPPFRMILVDHNEVEQSLPGVESLPVIEIVDHHRLKTMPTDQPIRFTADVVGSTCTLISKMYRDAGESLSPGLAGMLLAGIVTDTLNLKSPTTTDRDVKAVAWLEKLAGCTATQLMEELSSIASPLASQSASDVLDGDRKSYTEGPFSFALAQVEESNLMLLNQRQAELEQTMQDTMAKERLDFVGLLVTDPVRETSHLLLLGPDALAQALPYDCIGNHLYDLPGVLSRKKQLLPQILAAVRTLQKQ
jgi:manganese-dependent inorganic pyrophosphatase